MPRTALPTVRNTPRTEVTSVLPPGGVMAINVTFTPATKLTIIAIHGMNFGGITGVPVGDTWYILVVVTSVLIP